MSVQSKLVKSKLAKKTVMVSRRIGGSARGANRSFFAFERMPQELRDRIYDDAILENTTLDIGWESNFTVVANQKLRITICLDVIQFRRVSKRIRAEFLGRVAAYVDLVAAYNNKCFRSELEKKKDALEHLVKVTGLSLRYAANVMPELIKERTTGTFYFTPMVEAATGHIGAHVTSLVLPFSAIQGDSRAGRPFWGPSAGFIGGYDHVETVKRCLPNLREIALRVAMPPKRDPTPFGLTRQMYPAHVPARILELLRDGFVDTVRFLYWRTFPDVIQSCGQLRRAVSKVSQNLPRRKDRVVETSALFVFDVEELIDDKDKADETIRQAKAWPCDMPTFTVLRIRRRPAVIVATGAASAPARTATAPAGGASTASAPVASP